MSYTLKETEWAADAIASPSLGKSPYDTLRKVARYYIDEGMKPNGVYAEVEKYVLQCDKAASLVKWERTIDAAVQFAAKHNAVNIDKITVTESELETISKIQSGNQERRLAFTLLCLAKYWNVRNHVDSYWVNSTDSDIMKMANIKTSIKRQCKLYHDLRDSGLISFSHKIDCNHVCVSFANDDSPAMIEITDLRNLGNQYMMYIGQPYFACVECGIVIKKDNPDKGRTQKYCRDCAAAVKAQQSKLSHIKSKK